MYILYPYIRVLDRGSVFTIFLASTVHDVSEKNFLAHHMSNFHEF